MSGGPPGIPGVGSSGMVLSDDVLSEEVSSSVLMMVDIEAASCLAP